MFQESQALNVKAERSRRANKHNAAMRNRKEPELSRAALIHRRRSARHAGKKNLTSAELVNSESVCKFINKYLKLFVR